MNKESQIKLEKILKSTTWPLIVTNATAKDFSNAIIIPSDIPSTELGVISEDENQKYPTWAIQIIIKAKKSSNIILCIDSIDKVSELEQNKFLSLLKYKGINGFKLPTNTKIILTAKDTSNISKSIRSQSLIFKAE